MFLNMHLYIFSGRYLVRAWHPALAKAAGISLKTVCFFDIVMHNVFRILHASFFIMSFFTEGIDRAAGYAFPADIFSKM